MHRSYIIKIDHYSKEKSMCLLAHKILDLSWIIVRISLKTCLCRPLAWSWAYYGLKLNFLKREHYIYCWLKSLWETRIPTVYFTYRTKHIHLPLSTFSRPYKYYKLVWSKGYSFFSLYVLSSFHYNCIIWEHKNSRIQTIKIAKR